MPYVTIYSRDPGFDIRPMSDEDADKLMQQGDDPILIDDAVYDAWVAHQKQVAVFNTLWRTLQNQKRGPSWAAPNEDQARDRVFGKKKP